MTNLIRRSSRQSSANSISSLSQNFEDSSISIREPKRMSIVIEEWKIDFQIGIYSNIKQIKYTK